MASEDSGQTDEYFMARRSSGADRVTLATPIKWRLIPRRQPIKVRECRRGVYRLPPEMVIPFEMRVSSFWNRKLRLISTDGCGNSSMDDVISCSDDKVAADDILHIGASQQCTRNSLTSNNDRLLVSFTSHTHPITATIEDEGKIDFQTYVEKCLATTPSVQDAQLYTWEEPFVTAAFDQKWYTPETHMIDACSQTYSPTLHPIKDVENQKKCIEEAIGPVYIDNGTECCRSSAEYRPFEALVLAGNRNEARLANIDQNSSIQFAKIQFTENVIIEQTDVNQCNLVEQDSTVTKADTTNVYSGTPEDLIATKYNIRQAGEGVYTKLIAPIHQTTDYNVGEVKLLPTTVGEIYKTEDGTCEGIQQAETDENNETVSKSNDSYNACVQSVDEMCIAEDDISKDISDISSINRQLTHAPYENEEPAIFRSKDTATSIFNEEHQDILHILTKSNIEPPKRMHIDTSSSLAAEFDYLSMVDLGDKENDDNAIMGPMCNDGIDNTADTSFDGVDALSGYESGLSTTDCCSNISIEHTDTDGTSSDSDISTDIIYDVSSSDIADKKEMYLISDDMKQNTEGRSIMLVHESNAQNQSPTDVSDLSGKESDNTHCNKECAPTVMHCGGHESNDNSDNDMRHIYMGRDADLVMAANSGEGNILNDDDATKKEKEDLTKLRSSETDVDVSASCDNDVVFLNVLSLSHYPEQTYSIINEDTNHVSKIESKDVQSVRSDYILQSNTLQYAHENEQNLFLNESEVVKETSNNNAVIFHVENAVPKFVDEDTHLTSSESIKNVRAIRTMHNDTPISTTNETEHNGTEKTALRRTYADVVKENQVILDALDSRESSRYTSEYTGLVSNYSRPARKNNDKGYDDSNNDNTTAPPHHLIVDNEGSIDAIALNQESGLHDEDGTALEPNENEREECDISYNQDQQTNTLLLLNIDSSQQEILTDTIHSNINHQNFGELSQMKIDNEAAVAQYGIDLVDCDSITKDVIEAELQETIPDSSYGKITINDENIKQCESTLIPCEHGQVDSTTNCNDNPKITVRDDSRVKTTLEDTCTYLCESRIGESNNKIHAEEIFNDCFDSSIDFDEHLKKSCTNMPQLDINMLGCTDYSINGYQTNTCDYSPGATSGYESCDSTSNFTEGQREIRVGTPNSTKFATSSEIKRRRRNFEHELTTVHQYVEIKRQDKKTELIQSFLDILAVIMVTFNVLYWLQLNSLVYIFKK